MTDTPCKRFLGSPFGAFTMGETVFFYDEPHLFHCRDVENKPWLALKIDEDTGDRRSGWLLCPLTEEQLSATEGAADTDVLAVMRGAAATEGWMFYESWNDASCLKARRPSRTEIEDYF